MKRGPNAVVLALALGLGGVACTRGPAQPPPASFALPLDPRGTGPSARATACTLVTRDDAQAAVRAPLEGGEGAQGVAEAITTCSYHAAGRDLLVRMNPQTGDREQAAFAYPDPRPLSGLGDDARYSDGGADGLAALSVVRGQAGVTVLYRGPGDHLAICTAVAKAALNKL